jgi:heat shock protein HslJ
LRIQLLPVAALLGLSLVACSGAGEAPGSASPSPAGDPLDGIQWSLKSVADEPLPDGISATLALDAGQAAGSSGCNTFSGPSEVAAGGTIRVGPLASTRKACPDAVMSFEASYLAALEGVSRWAVPADAPMGTQLTLSGSGPKLVFGKLAGS